ncbi:MAG TPA: ubiquitin-like small modifier protein 1 [Anaeromyxobacteraceae bacterium]|jgi:adenylyltransferase/sulfurtransferase|nr:ubiquitin-like small modifier protein 1 [Anaeromyxobacteraceae bacterium]
MTVHVPAPLRPFTGQQAVLELPARTVGEALTELVSRHPELRRQLYGEDGRLRSFVNLYLNDQDIRSLQKEATPVREGDALSIVPAVAGGLKE